MRQKPLPGPVRSAALLLVIWLPSSALSLPAQRIVGTVPADWPTGAVAPVEVPVDGPVPGVRAGGSSSITVSLQIGDTKPAMVPAQFELTGTASHGRGTLRLLLSAKEADRGKPISIQIPGTAPVGGLLKGSYRMACQDPLLHVTTTDGKPILTYWYGAPDSRNAKKYPLNDFIQPLMGLDGETLTVASPPDHVHHRGIFWAWVRNERQDKWKAEWWIPSGIHVEPDDLKCDPEGPVYGRFFARHFWTYQAKDTDPAERFVEENLTCRVYTTTEQGRAVDLDLCLTALEDGVRIGGTTSGDKGYGGMTCRFAGPSDVKGATNVRIESDRGEVREETVNHLRATWVDWTGMFVGPDGHRLDRRSGAALMVHPSHPDTPPEWITRAYGPVNVAWPGLRMIDLPQGKPVLLRYRFWVHRGDPRAGGVPEQYRAYAADWKWTVK
jgi:hypothetical protein